MISFNVALAAGKVFARFRQVIAIATIAAAGGAPISAPALAQTSSTETVRTSVSYAGLDLSTDAAQATMQHRLRAAARKVCGFGGERDLSVVAHQNKCVAKALNGARAELAIATATSSISNQRIAVSGADDRNVRDRAR